MSSIINTHTPSPTFFCTKTAGGLQGELLGLTMPILISSSTYCLISSFSSAKFRYMPMLGKVESVTNWISCSMARRGGKPRISSKREEYSTMRLSSLLSCSLQARVSVDTLLSHSTGRIKMRTKLWEAFTILLAW